MSRGPRQLDRARAALAEGWGSLRDLEERIRRMFPGHYDAQASISARIRELRSEGVEIETRTRPGRFVARVTEYRIAPATPVPAGHLFDPGPKHKESNPWHP